MIAAGCQTDQTRKVPSGKRVSAVSGGSPVSLATSEAVQRATSQAATSAWMAARICCSTSGFSVALRACQDGEPVANASVNLLQTGKSHSDASRHAHGNTDYRQNVCQSGASEHRAPARGAVVAAW